MKYSGPKKENSNRLIEKFSDMIKNDRHYAKKAPLWTAQVLRIRHAFLCFFEKNLTLKIYNRHTRIKTHQR